MVLRKLSALFRRNLMADELEEEMRVHRDFAAAANRNFGNLSLLKEESMDIWRLNWVEDVLNDARFALRGMRARPLFTGIIVLTLALGVGANTAIFSLANALVLRMLPVRDAAELYYVHILPEVPDGAGNTGSGDSSFSYASYRTLRNSEAHSLTLSRMYRLASIKSIPGRQRRRRSCGADGERRLLFYPWRTADLRHRFPSG